MNAIRAISKPCHTVDEWLATHTVTKCPPGYALGLSDMEIFFGTMAKDTKNWYEQIRQRQENEVRDAKQKRLRSLEKSRK